MIVLQLALVAYALVGAAIGIGMFRDVAAARPGEVTPWIALQLAARCAWLAVTWLPDFALFCWRDRRG